jgi:hypothetical protein
MNHGVRTVSSYVTQMSLIKNCPAHIKGAYHVQDAKNLLFDQADEGESTE